MMSADIIPDACRAASTSVSSDRQRVFDVAASALEPESGGEKLDELVARQRRVVEIHDQALAHALRLQRRVHDGRLAGAGFADEQREAGSRRQAVLERRQRLAVTRGHEQKARVRRQLEGPLTKTVKGFVHSASPQRQNCQKAADAPADDQ